MATENQENKSRRDIARERLAKRHPDRQFDDDDAIIGQISDDYDELDGQMNGYKEREQKMVDMMSADPRSAHFLSSWANGDDPAIALVRMFGTDIKDAIDDPERQEQIAAANKEYVDRVAKSRHLEEEYKKNLDGTIEALNAFQQENGLTDDEVDEVMEFLQGIFQDAIVGKFSRESMEMARKAIKHDTDVEDAAQEAEVRGKNARVKEELRKRKETDGISALDGTPNAPKPKRQKSILELAREEEMGV